MKLNQFDTDPHRTRAGFVPDSGTPHPEEPEARNPRAPKPDKDPRGTDERITVDPLGHRIFRDPGTGGVVDITELEQNAKSPFPRVQR
jgi:hypothetical protein